MFLRNCWYVAGWNHHFPEDGLVTRTILGDPIVMANAPGRRMLQLASDGSLNQFRRLMAGLMNAEQQPKLAHTKEASHAVA
jgi:hypothetical protein